MSDCSFAAMEIDFPADACVQVSSASTEGKNFPTDRPVLDAPGTRPTPCVLCSARPARREKNSTRQRLECGVRPQTSIAALPPFQNAAGRTRFARIWLVCGRPFFTDTSRAHVTPRSQRQAQPQCVLPFSTCYLAVGSPWKSCRGRKGSATTNKTARGAGHRRAIRMSRVSGIAKTDTDHAVFSFLRRACAVCSEEIVTVDGTCRRRCLFPLQYGLKSRRASSNEFSRADMFCDAILFDSRCPVTFISMSAKSRLAGSMTTPRHDEQVAELAWYNEHVVDLISSIDFSLSGLTAVPTANANLNNGVHGAFTTVDLRLGCWAD